MLNATLKKIVEQTQVFLLDMDGTVYLGEKLIGDMKNTLQKIRNAGKRIVYLTNNSSKTQDEYVKKLERLQIFGENDCVYSSANATVEYLLREHNGKKVYLLATQKVKEYFKSQGVNLVEENPEVCVLAYDTEITFEKIRKFNEFLVKGAFYVVTHPDTVCPSESVSWPDLGSFIKLFECSANRNPDIICGKPFSVMGECVEKFLQIEKQKITMVGDRLHTDILFGVNSGFNTIVVLSGETTLEQAQTAKNKADVILSSLNDIVEYL